MAQITLALERARAARPGFELDAGTARLTPGAARWLEATIGERPRAVSYAPSAPSYAGPAG